MHVYFRSDLISRVAKRKEGPILALIWSGHSSCCRRVALMQSGSIPVYKLECANDCHFRDHSPTCQLFRMNAFPVSNSTSQQNLDVQWQQRRRSTSRMSDGTQVLVIKDDKGTIVTLPAAGVTKVA
ncbi:hypothetical protein JOM56_003658 [Amanita muscaria]